MVNKIKFAIFLILVLFNNFSFSKEKLQLPPLDMFSEMQPFLEIEAIVGYIEKENGERYAIIEIPEGVKLVKINKEKYKKRGN